MEESLEILWRFYIKNHRYFYMGKYKMKSSIDDLIQILRKQKKKIISSVDLKNFIYMSFWENTSINKIYKITFQLRNRWFLYLLRKDLFYITNPEKPFVAEEIEEQYYRKLLKNHCNNVCKQRYVWGLTALEVHLYGNGVTIPEAIVIINKEKWAVETLAFWKKILFKKYEAKWKNIFSQVVKLTDEVSMLNCRNILVANLELSILECLYNFDTTNSWYIEACIKKAIKKNGKSLDLQNIEKIIKLGKHNTSLNRLYLLVKPVYPSLSEEIKKLIKKYGFLLW